MTAGERPVQVPACNSEARKAAAARELLSVTEDRCCSLGCVDGGCEVCPCCSAGWCVWGHDGLPDDPADLADWLMAAADHNPLAAHLQTVQFTSDQLTMLHRAVRQKLSRVRNDMDRDRRKDKLHYAQGKARTRYDYATLLLELDAMVPEDRR